MAVTTKKYRYFDQLRDIAECPSEATAAFGCLAYRAVFEDIDDPRNFAPAALLDPVRLTSVKRDDDRCSMWSLSMFESPMQLAQRWQEIEVSIRNVRKKKGTHIAALEITATHGARTSATVSGHFSFYEFEEFEAKIVVTAVQAIP
jgi:hypothetical protein